ncbi:MAG: YhfC family glutamic-type intramembrane protease, partial [Thermoplasmata archaeon]
MAALDGHGPYHEDWGGILRFGTIIAFIISLLVQVGFPFALAIYYRRRTRVSWQIFVYGALVFAVFQLFTWLPVSVYLDAVVSARLQSSGAAFWWMMALALTTSLIEEFGRWMGYRYLFPRGGFRLTWRNGVMYGLGQGSLET